MKKQKYIFPNFITTKKIFKLVLYNTTFHTDIFGPKKTPLLAGNRYYAAFIDDFTRMCWIFFLKFKSEVAGAFWKFKKGNRKSKWQTNSDSKI